MTPMTAAALREVLADLPDDTEVIDAATGRPLIEADTDTGQVALTFAAPQPRRRSVTNTFVGNSATVLQIGHIRG